MMEPVSINEYFNNKNPWTKRLLGLDHFQKNRDIQQVENEYNLDKYAKLLGFDFKTAKEYKTKEIEQVGFDPVNGIIYISEGDNIFKTTVSESLKIYYELIQSTIKKYTSEYK